MIYLKQYLFQHKGKVLLTVLLLLGQVVGTLLIPALLAELVDQGILCLLYTSPSPRDRQKSRMPSSA